MVGPFVEVLVGVAGGLGREAFAEDGAGLVVAFVEVGPLKGRYMGWFGVLVRGLGEGFKGFAVLLEREGDGGERGFVEDVSA